MWLHKFFIEILDPFELKYAYLHLFSNYLLILRMMPFM